MGKLGFSIRLLRALVFMLLVNIAKAQVSGCTDPLAVNFNSLATQNDGTCVYNLLSITPSLSENLPAVMIETSGLVAWNNKLWTHNDSQDNNIYAFDTNNVNNYQSYALPGLINTDWEEISQDDTYFYIGDFGNNTNGNRTDLKIFRIEKNSVLLNSPIIDTINFAYSNQTDFTATGGNNTDFDCESFIVSTDSIYLFTKQWISQKTSIYSIPKTIGTHIANYRSTLDVQGLITGAVYKESQGLIVLCGYTNLLQPFIYVLYDFSGVNFFGANKRKINLSLSFHQVEGITTNSGLIYYISNEKFVQSPISIPAKLHTLDLSSYLSNYLNNIITNVVPSNDNDVFIYPVPSGNLIYIGVDNKLIGEQYSLFDYQGKIVLAGLLNETNTAVNIEQLNKGVYLVKLGNDSRQIKKLIKQ